MGEGEGRFREREQHVAGTKRKGKGHPWNVTELSLAAVRCECGWEGDQRWNVDWPKCQGVKSLDIPW